MDRIKTTSLQAENADFAVAAVTDYIAERLGASAEFIVDLPCRALLCAATSGFRPHQVLAYGLAGQAQYPGPVAPAVPLLADRDLVDGGPAAYVCRDFACQAPVTEVEAFGYVAYPLGLKGVVVGEGDTYEEALQDVNSAIAFHIETFGKEAFEDETSVLEAFVAETRVTV